MGGLHLPHVRAELLVELLVTALGDQVLVELAERGQERVRVVDRERAGVAVVDLELVAERQLGALDHPHEHAPGVDPLELDRRLSADQHGDGVCARSQRANDDAIVGRVRAEHAVGV